MQNSNRLLKRNPNYISFQDFISQYYSLKKDLDRAIHKVLSSGVYVLGDQVSSFELMLKNTIGVKYASGVANGTDAITLALMSLGIGAGDEVITTAFTAYPTIVGIQRSGAKPVLVDVRLEDGLINPELIEKKVNYKTKAIVPVHLYGQCCDMRAIKKVAKRKQLHIMEDCAQSIGASYGKKMSGSLGVCGAFSFYPTKNLGAFGDAGAITTNKKSIYAKIMRLRNYGQKRKNIFSNMGLNSRLDELQAALLSVKLKKLNSYNKKRRELASVYQKILPKSILLRKHAYGESAYHLFVVKVAQRSRIKRMLQKEGVETQVHYPFVANEHASFMGVKKSKYLNAYAMSRNVLSLPLYPDLTKQQVRMIATKLKKLIRI